MENDAKKAVAVGTQATTSSLNLSNAILAQQQPTSQAKSAHKSAKKRFRGDDTHPLGMDSKVNTLAIKCYEEQLPKDVRYPNMSGEEILYLNVRNSERKLVQVLCIKHDRDIVTDGIWKSAVVKPHYHIIVRFINDKMRMRVKQILESLHIYFRQGVDDVLILNHGLETVGKFAGYAMYLTHETEEAVRDAKELYAISEIVSNMTVDEIEQIREGYVRVSEKRKITNEELIALDKEAYKLGYELKNFDSWYNGQPFNVRANTKMRTIKESYERGSENRLNEDDAVIRLSIYIQGAGNLGKTYTSLKALKSLSIDEVYTIGGGGTGKFDKLRCDHQAVVVDDDLCPNLLNMADNKMCHVYKRNKNNPIWSGNHLIITYNEDFETYAQNCGIKTTKEAIVSGYRVNVESDSYKALLSRFFICEIVTDENTGVAHLACRSVSKRGTEEEQKKRLKMFIDFQEKFNEFIKDYQPKNIDVDYSSVLE